MSESYQVRFQDAVIASQAVGTLTPELIGLIQRMARKRVKMRDLASDLSQDVLCRVLEKLQKIDPESATEYIGTILVNFWRQHCLRRAREQRYLINYAANLIRDECDPVDRPPAWQKMFSSSDEVFRRKYW